MADADEQTITVYVPAEDSELRESIAPGSAIVGSHYQNTGRLRIDFEGNLYDLDDLEEFKAKLQRAAERHLANEGRGAETVACAYVGPEEVLPVGTFDERKGRLRVEQPKELEAWLSESDDVEQQ